MDGIPKTSGVSPDTGEGRRQTVYKKTERTGAAESARSFGDIYDVRLLSAELNRYSADFMGVMKLEAGKELNKVIGSLEQMERADELIRACPSEEIIALTKLAAERKER